MPNSNDSVFAASQWVSVSWIPNQVGIYRFVDMTIAEIFTQAEVVQEGNEGETSESL